jgi:putative SOS response-associated peptidase YedK
MGKGMCGRYAFFSPHEAVIGYFGLADAGPEFGPRYNIAPTQEVAAVRADPAGRTLAMLHWGLIPFWAKDRAIASRMINARAETLAEKPAYRAAFKKRRCVLPADGYYEWQSAAGGKQPYYVEAASGEPLALAGLWERWQDPSGETVESCTIITTEANAAMRHIHVRMPAILKRESLAGWLDPGADALALAQLFLPEAGPALRAHPVSRAVNSPAHQGPELIAAAAAI